MVTAVWVSMPLVAAAVYHCFLRNKPWFSSLRTFAFAACWGLAAGVVSSLRPCVELCDEYSDDILPALATGGLIVGSFIFMLYYTRLE